MKFRETKDFTVAVLGSSTSLTRLYSAEIGSETSYTFKNNVNNATLEEIPKSRSVVRLIASYLVEEIHQRVRKGIENQIK